MSDNAVWTLSITLLAIAYLGAEVWLYNRGHNTLLFSHKTEHEKRLREARVRILEREAGITPSSQPPAEADGH